MKIADMPVYIQKVLMELKVHSGITSLTGCFFTEGCLLFTLAILRCSGLFRGDHRLVKIKQFYPKVIKVTIVNGFEVVINILQDIPLPVMGLMQFPHHPSTAFFLNICLKQVGYISFALFVNERLLIHLVKTEDDK